MCVCVYIYIYIYIYEKSLELWYIFEHTNDIYMHASCSQEVFVCIYMHVIAPSAFIYAPKYARMNEKGLEPWYIFEYTNDIY